MCLSALFFLLRAFLGADTDEYEQSFFGGLWHGAISVHMSLVCGTALCFLIRRGQSVERNKARPGGSNKHISAFLIV